MNVVPAVILHTTTQVYYGVDVKVTHHAGLDHELLPSDYMHIIQNNMDTTWPKQSKMEVHC